MNLAAPLAHHARARPDHPAIVAGDTRILYKDLDGIVRRTAALLAARGIRQGDVVGLALRDTPDHLISILALAARGAVVLPLDWRWTAAEQERVAQHFNAVAVLLEPHAPWNGPAVTLRCDAGWQAEAKRTPSLDTLPDDQDLPFLLSLSSGTTGAVKGPLVTHGQFLRRYWPHWINMGLNAQSRFVSATPLYFGGGRTFALSQLFSGGTVILFPPPYEPQELVEEVNRRQATALFLVPTLLRRLLALEAGDGALMPSLTLLLSSGSALHANERRAIRQQLTPHLYEMYATTEGGGVSLLTPEDQRTHGDSVGRALFGVEVEVVADDGTVLPPGATGVLRYRGPGCATRLHGASADDAGMFVDGWFYPGDIGLLDEDGYLFLKGRRKDVIIRGGVNIHPTEVEEVLLSHPGVAEAAVAGKASAELGEEVVAFVVLAAGTTVAELRTLCEARLAPYKRPSTIEVVDDMPRNSSGKILKDILLRRLPPAQR